MTAGFRVRFPAISRRCCASGFPLGVATVVVLVSPLAVAALFTSFPESDEGYPLISLRNCARPR
jgi:hypothetical protein